jgi:hypothetical protein
MDVSLLGWGEQGVSERTGANSLSHISETGQMFNYHLCCGETEETACDSELLPKGMV